MPGQWWNCPWFVLNKSRVGEKLCVFLEGIHGHISRNQNLFPFLPSQRWADLNQILDTRCLSFVLGGVSVSDWGVRAEHGDALWKSAVETACPPGRTENQHSPDTNWKSNSHPPLPDEWVWLLLGHQPVQGSDWFQDSTGTVVKQAPQTFDLVPPERSHLSLLQKDQNSQIPLFHLVGVILTQLKWLHELETLHLPHKQHLCHNPESFETLNLWSWVGEP